MSTESALKFLAERALASHAEDNLAIYDALARVAKAARCPTVFSEADTTASAIRAADSAQMRFLEFLAPFGAALKESK